MPLTAQSNVENNPPQTPKFPPSTGALALIAVRAPILRSPYGLLRNPLTPCQTDPPIAYDGALAFFWCRWTSASEDCYMRPSSEKRVRKREWPVESAEVVHTPMQKAPPKSFNATQGHGSLVWSIFYDAFPSSALSTFLSSNNSEGTVISTE